MTFFVGQQVECIDPVNDLILAKIYTVTASGVGQSGDPMVTVAESKYQIDFAFFAARFRPITESKSEISFTHGADPSTDGLDNRRKVREPV